MKTRPLDIMFRCQMFRKQVYLSTISLFLVCNALALVGGCDRNRNADPAQPESPPKTAESESNQPAASTDAPPPEGQTAGDSHESGDDIASTTSEAGTKLSNEPTTAEEIAVDPRAAGFEEIGAMVTNGVDGKEWSRDQQWKRKNADGTVQILTVRSVDGKIVGATLMEVNE